MLQEKSKILFIINPKSGVLDKEKIVNIIVEYLDTSKYAPEFVWTKYSGHSYKIAKQAVAKNIPFVVAVGGDGSVHNTASGLVGSQTVLGIIPIGSGNGMARHLEIPTQIPNAVLTLNQQKIRCVDVGRINRKYFFNVAGFGFDGRVAKLFSKSNKRGLFRYAQLVMREFVKTKQQDFSLEFENGEILTDSALMINMANASQFGNGFSISPLSNLHDGHMELVVTKKPNLFSFPMLLKKAVDHQVHQSSYVKTYRFKKLNIIKANHEFHADGEPIALKFPVQIEVIPQALKVIAGENYV
jgi:YegS/Rv2252/BmrU family lipid kinase